VVDDGVTGSARESTPSSSRRSVVEVVTRGEPRRRWSEEDRVRILAEAMAPGAIASHVARRFGVSTGQFYTWRKAMLLRSAPVGVVPVLATADFAEVRLSAPPPKPSTPSPIPPTGMMEIALPGGALIRVDAAVDGAALGRVLTALAGR
jgi:transposase